MKSLSGVLVPVALLVSASSIIDAYQVTPTTISSTKTIGKTNVLPSNPLIAGNTALLSDSPLFSSRSYPSKRRRGHHGQEVHVSSSAVMDADTKNIEIEQKLGKISAFVTKLGMVCFVLSMCITLPLSLLPIELSRKAGIITTTQRETLSLRAGQFCSRWCLRLFPFAKLKVIPPEDVEKTKKEEPEPSIWVCNHTSMLDVFFLLAADKKMRGGNKRPIKIVYWKQLEANPVTRILFQMCGFIPIDMVANAPGEDNQYDPKTFKAFLRAAKKAFADGFDIGILPEGQLNPSPESGLLPVFTGAYTLAKMSRRPIKMIALNGAHKLWHATEGMKVRDRTVTVRAYPSGRKYSSPDDFTDVFVNVVGHFGAKGKDVDNLGKWLKPSE